METTEEGNESMWGSIIYHQEIEDHDKQTVLQYYLSKDRLITSQIDVSFLYRLSEEQLLEKLQTAENAIEGFMILLGEIVASFLQDIDAFENRMHQLLWRIKKKNNDEVLDQIMDNRHEILVWKNLIIPIIEIREAMQEAFGDFVADGRHYQRTCRRLSRCREIIREYDEEVREMIDLETVISSHRGNEIVKTLTVITMLFTPIAAWGALWGMNFEVMPELKWKYGYLIAIAVILLSTWGLYFFLQKKNWIGSVLKNPKNRKF
ncbi:MAG: magnesium transporter CorA family protein [Planococcus donghaensis]